MPLGSRRLKWFRNTAIRTCDFFHLIFSPSLLFTETVKASHSNVLQLSAGSPSDSEGTTFTESKIGESSVGEALRVLLSSFVIHK